MTSSAACTSVWISCSRAAAMAALALMCVGIGPASAQAGRELVLEDRIREILGDLDATISDDGAKATTKIRCGMRPFGEGFCMQSSIIIYSIVMKAIRDQTIDVTGSV